jgi:hypothetical protein
MIENMHNNIDIGDNILISTNNLYDNDEYDNNVIFLRMKKESNNHSIYNINLNDLNDFKNSLKYKTDDSCCICYEKMTKYL